MSFLPFLICFGFNGGMGVLLEWCQGFEYGANVYVIAYRNSLSSKGIAKVVDRAPAEDRPKSS